MRSTPRERCLILHQWCGFCLMVVIRRIHSPSSPMHICWPYIPLILNNTSCPLISVTSNYSEEFSGIVPFYSQRLPLLSVHALCSAHITAPWPPLRLLTSPFFPNPFSSPVHLLLCVGVNNDSPSTDSSNGSQASSSQTSMNSCEEMTMDEIFNGKGKYYPGLIPLVYAYLDYIRWVVRTSVRSSPR